MQNYLGIEKDLVSFQTTPIFFESIDGFKRNFSMMDGSYSINLNETSLDLECTFFDKDVLVFVYTGAKAKAIAYPPLFMGRGISKGLKASFIYYSDPGFTKDLSVKIGWYCGTKLDDTQSVIKDLNDFFISKIKPKRVIFFGGSEGGFASLFFSSYVKNSVALVWNPQIVLKNYPKHVTEEYVNLCYNLKSIEEIDRFTNLVDVYKKGQAQNKIVYIQNITDTGHVNNHMTPFLNFFKCKVPTQTYSKYISDDVFLHLTDWRKGHRPPHRDVVRFLLESFIECPEYNTNNLNEIFKKAEEVSQNYEATLSQDNSGDLSFNSDAELKEIYDNLRYLALRSKYLMKDIEVSLNELEKMEISSSEKQSIMIAYSNLNKIPNHYIQNALDVVSKKVNNDS